MNDKLTLPLLAFAACAFLTPAVRSLALRLGIVDAPDGRRKLHRTVIPLGGGVAIYLALVFSFLVPGIEHDWRQAHFPFLAGLMGAVSLIVIIGLLDDRFQLRGRQKLLGQTLAASALIVSGLLVERIQVFNWQIELGLLAIPFTLFWLCKPTTTPTSNSATFSTRTCDAAKGR